MKHTIYFNLLEALKEGCPVCFLVRKSTKKFMDDFLYESVNDPALRKEIKESLGFCNRHAWQLQKLGDGFGQSIIYEDLAKTVFNKLNEIKVSSNNLKTLLPDRKSKATCIFCKYEKDAQDRYIFVFIENFNDPEFRYAYKDSFGLCLPHLEMVIRRCKNQEIVDELMFVESQKIAKLSEELKEFIRKHDYRFSKEGFDKEKAAWIRAVEKLTGKEDLS
jgi:hypothetical protein